MKKIISIIIVIVCIVGGVLLGTYLVNKHINTNTDTNTNLPKENEIISIYDNPKIPEGFKSIETDQAS